jgi:hypothetical protein
MRTRKIVMMAALISIAPAGLVMAQSGSTPQDTTPATASSPSATESPSSTNESPSSSNSSSSSSSSSTTQHHMASKQAMKDCVAKQKQDNQGMSSADAKKACKQQMKGSG